MTPSLATLLARTTRMRNGCRLWTGARNDRGYPTCTVAGRKVYVHRLACETRHGPLPPGHEARHSPACEAHGLRGRLCVEPSHLTPGTRSENARDRERARRARGATTKPQGASVAAASRHCNARQRAAGSRQWV